MRQGQPVGELPGRLVRRLPVKRHHRRRDAGRSQQLCPPAIADGRDLDQVRAPANGLFEAMCGHSVIVRCK